MFDIFIQALFQAIAWDKITNWNKTCLAERIVLMPVIPHEVLLEVANEN